MLYLEPMNRSTSLYMWHHSLSLSLSQIILSVCFLTFPFPSCSFIFSLFLFPPLPLPPSFSSPLFFLLPFRSLLLLSLPSAPPLPPLFSSFPLPSPPPQVFHRTPAYEDGSLCPGDELVTVSGVSLRGYSRKQTADLIQSSKVSQTLLYPDEFNHTILVEICSCYLRTV